MERKAGRRRIDLNLRFIKTFTEHKPFFNHFERISSFNCMGFIFINRAIIQLSINYQSSQMGFTIYLIESSLQLHENHLHAFAIFPPCRVSFFI